MYQKYVNFFFFPVYLENDIWIDITQGCQYARPCLQSSHEGTEKVEKDAPTNARACLDKVIYYNFLMIFSHPKSSLIDQSLNSLILNDLYFIILHSVNFRADLIFAIIFCKIFNMQEIYPVLFAIRNCLNPKNWLMQILKRYTFPQILWHAIKKNGYMVNSFYIWMKMLV